MSWTVHGADGSLGAREVVRPGERLSWPRTIGIGSQHVVAMFGATFLVPLLTGFPPATTLFFSAVGTMLFLIITAGRVPSYLGSSFAFIAPIAAAKADHGMAGALGGVVLSGLALGLIGVIVHVAGAGWLRTLMPPVVTGAVVALIGLNLAPSAKDNVEKAPVTAVVTLVVVVLVTVLAKGLLGRLGILIGVVSGYLLACVRGEVDFAAIDKAAWIGFPEFTTPSFHLGAIGLFVPVVLVLVAENIGHVKSVALMTGDDLDPVSGRALIGDGVATTLAGFGGGSGTTTYAENIGVMAATKVYSTAAYWVAAIVALLLSLSPKFGAAISTVPPGVLGGAATVLYGMVGLLGARIWIENKVDLGNPINLMTGAIALIVGIADFTWAAGDLTFSGIALGTIAAILVFHVMCGLNRWTKAVPDPLTPAGTMDEPVA